MKKICWIISLINVLKDKFSSIYWIKKQQRDSENTMLEEKSFHLWLGKNLNEKVNHTPHQMKTPLRIENCQQKKTLSQVAHLVYVVSLAGSEHALNSQKNLWIHALYHFGLIHQRKEAKADRSPLPALYCTIWQGHTDSALEETDKRFV